MTAENEFDFKFIKKRKFFYRQKKAFYGAGKCRTDK